MTIDRSTLSDRVAQHLTQRIREERLVPGDPFPPEAQTSLELNVSRGIVREAYRAMAAAGIIETANGKRPRVAKLTGRTLTPAFDHAAATEQASQADFLQLRRLIEVDAARVASQRADAQARAKITRAALAMAETGTDSDAFVQADIAFHKAIASATGNLLFVIFLEALNAQLLDAIRVGMQSRASAAEHERVFELHRLIAAAIEDGDAEEAARLMTSHFDEAVEAIAANQRRAAD